MIRKKPAPHSMRGGHRFSLATNAERVCAEIMLKQKDRARRRFEEESSRSILTGCFREGIPRIRRRRDGPVYHLFRSTTRQKQRWRARLARTKSLHRAPLAG